MAYTPNPEDAQHTLFFIKWWKEFFLALGALTVAILTAMQVRHAPKIPIIPMITEDQIKLQMAQCKREIAKDINAALRNHERRMLHEIKLLIKNAILEERTNGK